MDLGGRIVENVLLARSSPGEHWRVQCGNPLYPVYLYLILCSMNSGPCACGYRSNQLEADDALWRMHANHADAEPRRSEVCAERTTTRNPHTQVAAADTFPAGAAAAGIDAEGAASGVGRPETEGVPTTQLGVRIK